MKITIESVVDIIVYTILFILFALWQYKKWQKQTRSFEKERRGLWERHMDYILFEAESSKTLRDNRFVLRLIEDWKIYGKVIIATEYYDTLKYSKFNPQKECDKVIAVLKLAKEVGAYVVVFTNGDQDVHEEIKSFCKSKGLEIDAINSTPVQLPYSSKNKVGYNWLLDVKSDLEGSLRILEFASYSMRSHKHSPNEQTVEF